MDTRLRGLAGAVVEGRHWTGFFALVLAAWAALYAMQLPPELAAAADAYGAGFWAALCRVGPGAAGAPAVFAMWALMSAAMMAPGVVPHLATYRDLAHAGAGARGGFAALAAGYLAVWVLFSGVAAAMQLVLAAGGLVTPLGESVTPALSVALLAGAGAYQFSPLKDACLRRCRQPLTFFMQHWAPGSGAAMRMGLRLGVFCLGCCWALMLLAFVGGTMNLLWMGGAMVLMTLEKMPAIGAALTRPVGFALLGAAGAALIF